LAEKEGNRCTKPPNAISSIKTIVKCDKLNENKGIKILLVLFQAIITMRTIIPFVPHRFDG
jgi:hypothetical protein